MVRYVVKTNFHEDMGGRGLKSDLDGVGDDGPPGNEGIGGDVRPSTPPSEPWIPRSSIEGTGSVLDLLAPGRSERAVVLGNGRP
jgi:hypothetical protein